jgi:hypothetical protein
MHRSPLESHQGILMMNRIFRSLLHYCLPSLCLAAIVLPAHGQWTAPTAEELQMTSQPEVPGAPAVYLFREEITDDSLHNWSKYVRLKVLTERGKEYANVELQQYQDEDGGGYTVSEIQGRTIHPDGTVIPFTGKPFQKLIEKTGGVKVMAKVFTLPDVEVGSIIEYRYNLRYADDNFYAPDWLIQSELYTRKAHYVWRPTNKQLISKNARGEQLTSRIAWAPVLPVGAQIQQNRQPPSSQNMDGQLTFDLNVHDIPPVPEEEYMPPVRSLSYRVMFYYTGYQNVDEYWKEEGKGWSKLSDKFIGPGSKVGAAVQSLVAPTDTSDQKLRKLYAAVMQLDNTSYSRSHSAAEDKSQGMNAPKNTDDIWERKRGNDDQLAELFVAMARASGMKAYLMNVTNRDTNLFFPSFLNFSQFDDNIAIVNVDGKEQFFDPGQRYCPYGQLAWKHSLVQGLRQTDGGTAIAGTPSESYKDSITKRIADLKMDDQGAATGTVLLSYTGAPALRWRQAGLVGDDTSLNHDLQTTIEHMLPKDTDVKIVAIDHLTDYEQPLVVHAQIKGQIGSGAGKRLLVPGDIFEFNATPEFPHAKRDIAVYFEYPTSLQDAVRVTYPPTLAVESQPASESLPFGQTALYVMNTKAAPNSVTVYRNLLRGEIIYTTQEYPDLRTFYNKLATKDQEPIIFKLAAQAPAGN